MSLTKIAIYAAIALALIAAYVGWANHQQGIGYDRRQAEQTAADLAASAENRRIEQRRQSMAGEITKAKDEKILNINDRLLAALGELRNRPERRSAAAVDTADCKGATGAELSRPDSEFLERLAARADTIRAGLEACYAQYESLTIK